MSSLSLAVTGTPGLHVGPGGASSRPEILHFSDLDNRGCFVGLSKPHGIYEHPNDKGNSSWREAH